MQVPPFTHCALSRPPPLKFSYIGGVHSAAGSRVYGGQDECSELVRLCHLPVWDLTACSFEDLLLQR